jgi:CheY-like chemotaxis protein
MDKPLLLIIDDEPDFIDVLEVTLIDDYAVESFTNPMLAITKAANSDIRLILTDIGMPEMGGVEVVKSIRAVNPLVPILLVTGLSRNDDDVLNALKAGGTDVLEKPIRDPRLITETIRKLIAV